MKSTVLAAAIILCATSAPATDFKGQVAPVLQKYCYKCHSEVQKKEKGDLVLDNLERFGRQIGPSGIIKPGQPDSSSFFTSMTLPKSDDDHMPPAKEAQPPPASIAIIKAWITEGASLDGKKVATTPAAPTAPAAPAAPGAAATQTWTSSDGIAIQASFLRLEGENVVIQRADGVCFILPLARLSAESQALAKNGGK